MEEEPKGLTLGNNQAFTTQEVTQKKVAIKQDSLGKVKPESKESRDESIERIASKHGLE